MGRLVIIYKYVKEDLPLFLWLYVSIKKERLSKPQIAELLKTKSPFGLEEESGLVEQSHLGPSFKEVVHLEKELEKKGN